MKAHAHRADDILTALRIAREFDLDVTIEHCTEGYRIPEYLLEEKAKIIVGPLFSKLINSRLSAFIISCNTV
jgi:imidazolonepropionase-like amidohydrolase